MASFDEFARVCQSLGQTGSRLQIAALAGEFLAHLPVDEAEIAARFMVGRAIAQGEDARLNVSGRAVWRIVAAMTDGGEQGEDIFAAATDFGEAIELLLRLRNPEPPPTLTLSEVNRRLGEIAEITGRSSRKRKLDALRELFELASNLEGKYLAKILIGEMRHGMSDGLMLEAIATMAGRPVAEVRRAHMLDGDLGRVVRAMRIGAERVGVSDGGAEAPPSETPGPAADIPIRVSTAPLVTARPLKPMLAAPAPSVAEAMRALGERMALEHKLDGARVQIHRTGDGVRIFSRRLNEITASLPEVMEIAARLASYSAILDGEVIAVDREGRPLAFQEIMRRFGRVHDIERLRTEQPIRLFVFDLIARDGRLMIDSSYEERYAALRELAEDAGLNLAERCIPASLAEANQFYARAIEAGYEGIMAKGLDSLYTPGARGRGWFKIKTARTFDLVIVAADWGYGRRHGWLSNYHLAARDPVTGGFVEVGKTFKGMTDADFQEMTERLTALKIGEGHGTVFVRPEVVVEIAYSDIQRSPQYAGGMALRFARVVGIRKDKSADEADTIQAVAQAFERQLVKPVDDRG